jgi:hypothetical protein
VPRPVVPGSRAASMHCFWPTDGTLPGV